VGTWGTGLYADDYAADLRDDLMEMIRAPWDGDRLLAWALEHYPSGNDPTDDEFPKVRLVLADLFWLYGIEHPLTIETGLRIIAEGSDLAVKRRLEMSESNLRRRARVLDRLAAKWRTPNPRPRPRHILEQPEPFVLQVGDCLIYPLRQGAPRNPYVGPRFEARFYGPEPWTPDGWGAACVLARWHRFDVFARYLVAVLRLEGATRPALADFPGLSMLSYKHPRGWTQRGAYVVSTSRLHLRRMRIEIVGRLAVRRGSVLWEFPPDRPPMASPGGDFSNYADLRLVSDRGAVPMDDPLASFLA
jgi:hypothetical protein